MNTSEWTKTQLPKVAERLYEELLALDPVPEEYAGTPVAAAWYHLSRHAMIRRKVPRGGVKANLPPPCPQPLPGARRSALPEPCWPVSQGHPESSHQWLRAMWTR